MVARMAPPACVDHLAGVLGAHACGSDGPKRRRDAGRRDVELAERRRAARDRRPLALGRRAQWTVRAGSSICANNQRMVDDYFAMSAQGAYRITVEIRSAGAVKSVLAEFVYRHNR